jgi:TfoX/Sxy family transcriptional regulator of competence genes
MRTRFDGFAKDLWRDSLGDLGKVDAEVEIVASVQRVDTIFEPDQAQVPQLASRGLLGRLATERCMLEAFHDTPNVEEVVDCLRKFLAWRHRLGDERSVARLWLVVAGAPKTACRAFGLRQYKGWPRGVFSAAPGLGLGLVSVAGLPVNRDTLALRLFGRGRVLRCAGQELLALPEDAWERRLIALLLRWRTQIPELPALRSTDEEDFVNNAQQILDEWERKAIQKGREEGLGPLLRQFERRLGRVLTDGERRELTLRSTDEEDFVKNAQQLLDEWERKAIQKGREEGLGPLLRQFERRLGRALTEGERRELTLRSTDEEDFVNNAQQLLDEWERKAIQKGREEGLGPLLRQFERRLGRALTEVERGELRRRLGALGPTRLGDVVLDLAPPALDAWLSDPAAQ